MSRFKLFALFSMFAGMIRNNPKKSEQEKADEIKSLNRQSGGVLFGGSHIPSRTPNQRQKRKLKRQTQNSK